MLGLGRQNRFGLEGTGLGLDFKCFGTETGLGFVVLRAV